MLSATTTPGSDSAGAREQQGAEHAREAGGDAYRHLARRCVVATATDVAAGLLDLSKNLLGVRGQSSAGRRGLDTTRLALEQPRTELALECRDVLAQRGLGDRQARAAE
ncbi:MAG: hypothetical protein R3E48_12155 [Burkholderiaceae bacterium]